MMSKKVKRKEKMPGINCNSPPITKDILTKKLSQSLLENDLCSSIEEAAIISEEIVTQSTPQEVETIFTGDHDYFSHLIQDLQDFFDLEASHAKMMVTDMFIGVSTDYNNIKQTESEEENEEDSFEEIEEEEKEEYLIDGECELCERHMKLTSHHLVPKSVWPKLKKQVFESKKNSKIREETLSFLVSLTTNIDCEEHEHKEVWTRKKLHSFLSHYTCKICRPCHSTIHSVHDNTSLAKHYSTVDKLLTDRDIYKFCKWASKQKPGKYR